MQERIVDSPEEISGISMNILIDAAAKAARPSAALPGGRSILPVLAGIRRLPDEILGRYSFFLADERWERDHNGEMLHRELFDPLLEEGRMNREQIRFPDVSRTVEEETREYGKDIPDLSVVFLGVGEDGHVASLFPGHPALRTEGKTAYLTDSPKPPPTRLTVTFDGFSRAAKHVLIFWGEGKGEAYRRFTESDDWKSTPACYFKRFDTTLVIRDGRIGR